MKKASVIAQFALLVLTLIAFEMTASAATNTTAQRNKAKQISENAHARRNMSRLRRSRIARSRRGRTRYVRRRHHHYYERFYTSSFSDDVADGDITTGEDPMVRAAAVEALGNMNGTVVAIDPTSGRILAMVNQKLALSSGAQPCSTIKLSVALAALSEGVIDKYTKIRLGRRFRLNLTQALAHSNNAYFEVVGRKLGFETVTLYAHQFGLGELAGYDIPGEQVGDYPDHVIPVTLGGVEKMCSFGEGVSMTPLQLGAMVSAIANGGTLYYLQHPTTPDEVANFQPRIKRQLNIAPLIPEISDGMAGAVEYGTARSVRVNFNEEEILGKTGTCSKDGTRFGWFASYANTSVGRIVVVVFLQGGRPTFGAKAAEIAGRMYRDLYGHSFFLVKNPTTPEYTPSVQTVGAPQ
jgi:penicillin-binding protein 2